MNKKMAALLLCVTLMAILFSGCTEKIDSPIPLPSPTLHASATPEQTPDKNDEKSVIGRWETEADDQIARAYVLNDDGSYVMEIQQADPKGVYKLTGKYDVIQGDAALKDLAEAKPDIQEVADKGMTSEDELYSIKFYFGEMYFEDELVETDAEEGSFHWMYGIVGASKAVFGRVDSAETVNLIRVAAERA